MFLCLNFPVSVTQFWQSLLPYGVKAVTVVAWTTCAAVAAAVAAMVMMMMMMMMMMEMMASAN